MDALEAQMSAGGVVADYHSSGFFPERCGSRRLGARVHAALRKLARRAERVPCRLPRSWFDLVVVLQTDNGVLYDRLQKRCVLRAVL